MKVGDRVRLKEDIDSPKGPLDAGLIGTIRQVGISELPLDVYWDNGVKCRAALDEVELLQPGKWQREMPQAVGMYWTRTSDGLEAGIVAVCELSDGQLFTPAHLNETYVKFNPEDRKSPNVPKILPGTRWGGWWWSEPVMPCPPFDKEKSNA